jgi:hypothetical protein
MGAANYGCGNLSRQSDGEMTPDELPSYLIGDKGQLTAAGIAGGIVRWLTLRESTRDGFISVVVGALCSLYLGPIGLPLLEPVIGKLTVDPHAAVGLSGFLIGVGGIAVSGFVLDLWAMRRSKQKERVS